MLVYWRCSIERGFQSENAAAPTSIWRHPEGIPLAEVEQIRLEGTH